LNDDIKLILEGVAPVLAVLAVAVAKRLQQNGDDNNSITAMARELAFHQKRGDDCERELEKARNGTD
jgi:hypothetical protein